LPADIIQAPLISAYRPCIRIATRVIDPRPAAWCGNA
jgi:hypothetical protein